MVKIAVGICTYAEPLGLHRLLDSINRHVELIVVVHGPFPNFGLLTNESIDVRETLVVCQQYRNLRLINIPEPTHENERRETYLALMKDYDFCITIDSDEYIVPLETGWDAFRQNCQNIIDSQSKFYIYDLWYKEEYEAHSGPRPRLFYQPSRIKYYKKHYWFQLPNGIIAAGCSDSRKVVNGIQLQHDKSHRTEERKQAMYKHQDWIRKYDSQFVLTDRQKIV